MTHGSAPPGSPIRYLWPMRVPLLGAATLIALPWIAFLAGARPYLSGLFDPIDARALMLITPLALFNAWTAAIIAGLILTYGRERLGLPGLAVAVFPVRRAVWILSALLAVPVVVTTMWYMRRASNHDPAAIAGWTTLGAASAVALLVVTIGLTGVLARAGDRFREGFPHSLASRLYERLLGWLASRPALAAGFIERRGDGRLRLGAGHGLALGLASASVALYVTTGFVTRDVQRPEYASAIGYVLLLILVLTWLVGFVAFLFDRARLPLMLIGALWILVVNVGFHPVFPTGHIYRTVAPDGDAPPLTPAAELLSDDTPSIVVAASGGGIQAAVWAARVLTSLRTVPGFERQLRLISGVSGGSVGAMYVVAALPRCGPDGGDAAFVAPAAAAESSLHAVGWGLIFKDLPRAIVPFFSSPYVDRGSLLEDAWKREARLQQAAPDSSSFLASWRRNVAEGRCPAVVYNAMSAETGEPMLFATVGLPASLAAFDFYARYPERDIPVTTAARLSATFPFVSPAARADADDEARGYTHVVDGGYFDNYGISALSAIVHAALEPLPARPDRPRRVLVLEVCDSSSCSGDPAPSAPSAGGEDRAWPYQLVAPLSAVVAMRSAAQRAANRTTLRLLKDYWRTQGACIESLPLAFGEGETPMSWHMTGIQKRAIDDAWSRIGAAAHETVERFLEGEAVTSEGRACLSEARARAGQ
jgi:hypothetical protein